MGDKRQCTPEIGERSDKLTNLWPEAPTMALFAVELGLVLTAVRRVQQLIAHS